MSAANDVLSQVRISEVYTALTGLTPRRTGRDTWRGPATWRNGDGFNVSMDDSRGVWHDFVTGEGGGVLDLVQRVQGVNRADALRWVADFAGVTLDDRPATRETRRAIGERREREQRELQEAGFFRFAAVRMAEEILDVLPEAVPERSGPTQLRLALRTAEGAALLAIYRDFRSREPRLTAGLVFSGERAWNRLCKRLALSIEVQHVA